ncbi:hypothetical protein O6H91_11G000400 [Diphasiastrum complanatum]|uniref:Uncharacterized protein n=1 Tax=Diphasiastrum complanatum TaxID=34168 RepID=A0ACC2C5Q5_DIPCM|nr:hypothetical protein O6H91_11G000400 [Diphasiastrum complanatum]
MDPFQFLFFLFRFKLDILDSSEMDQMVQSLQNAYQALLSSVATVMEVKEAVEANRTLKTDAALEGLYQNWQLFHVACDRAQEYVESVRQRIGSDCLVDEATGPLAVKPSGEQAGHKGTAIAPLSAVRLEQLSKAVRWLVIELQHGSSSSAGHIQGHVNGTAVAIENRPGADEGAQ